HGYQLDTRGEQLIIRQLIRKRAKYRGKTHGRPVGTNHCKFLSSHPRVPDDGRNRALDGGRQKVEPLRPSGRDYDPDWLSPRLAGVRVVRFAMVGGRTGHRPATRPQGEERLAECPPDAGRRDTRAPTGPRKHGQWRGRKKNGGGTHPQPREKGNTANGGAPKGPKSAEAVAGTRPTSNKAGHLSALTHFHVPCTKTP